MRRRIFATCFGETQKLSFLLEYQTNNKRTLLKIRVSGDQQFICLFLILASLSLIWASDRGVEILVYHKEAEDDCSQANIAHGYGSSLAKRTQ